MFLFEIIARAFHFVEGSICFGLKFQRERSKFLNFATGFLSTQRVRFAPILLKKLGVDKRCGDIKRATYDILRLGLHLKNRADEFPLVLKAFVFQVFQGTKYGTSACVGSELPPTSTIWFGERHDVVLRCMGLCTPMGDLLRPHFIF